MVIDNQITVVGTFNLDPRSANLNTECVVVVNSSQISEGVLKGMEIEFKSENSWETTLDFNPDAEVGNYKRLKTWTRKLLPKSIL
jgi:phosphatidylserine/phosphatidylglycerophosphate/cardiolipin synthase-like enzyme